MPSDQRTGPYLAPPSLLPELAQHPRYCILRELGRGGMGVVYLARHTVMNREVVIKVISKALLDHPDALERFRREVQAAAKLSHPNIVAAYDAEQAGALHLLAMEFVPGQSLAEVVKNTGPLPVAQACEFVRQAARGLQHAHEQGMVHRDIKPHNLMLTPQGQVKILDFGLAKVASERDAGKGLTASGAYMGTPEYSAPEQATDARTADIRADLYSLGCTLYCLLAGHPPFREDTSVLTILAHRDKEPPPLPHVRPDVPAGLWAVVARLLAKDPARRFQEPVEVAQALDAFCQRPGNDGPVPPGTMKPTGGTVPAVRTRREGDVGKTGPQAAAARSRPRARRGTNPDPGPAGEEAADGGASSPGPSVVSASWSWSGWGRRAAWSPGTGMGRGPTAVESLLPHGRPLLARRGARPAALDCTGPAGVSAVEVKQAQAAWARYLGRPVEETVEVGDGVKMTFVLVPPGRFRMGAPPNEPGRNWLEAERHPESRFDAEALHGVVLTEPFDLGQTEVTQEQYQAVTGYNPSQSRGAGKPVENLSWEEARDCAVRLTNLRGDRHRYRLPTEAEWEYACRGGRSSSCPFGVGDGRALTSREANFDGKNPYPPGRGVKGPNLQGTCRVGSYPANALGLFDMHGNAWEWCADWYGPYPAGEVTDPTGPATGKLRVIRGGGWREVGWGCRAAIRTGNDPGPRGRGAGIRLARSVPPAGP